MTLSSEIIRFVRAFNVVWFKNQTTHQSVGNTSILKPSHERVSLLKPASENILLLKPSLGMVSLFKLQNPRNTTEGSTSSNPPNGNHP